MAGSLLEVSLRTYFLPLLLITRHQWARMSHAAKAILPAIGVHADDNGKAWPGMKLIRQLSGCIRSETVRAGIRSLIETHLLEKTREGRHNVYYLKPPAITVGKSYYPMSEEFIKTEWRSLSYIEKAVFGVLAVKAGRQNPDWPDIDPEQYDNLPAWASRVADFGDDEDVFGHAIIQKRKWIRLAGIARSKWDIAIKGLIEKGQIVLSEENHYVIHK